MLRKQIAIEVVSGSYAVVPQSEGNVWVQEEVAPVFFGEVAQGPKHLGELIRQAEPFSRESSEHGEKFTDELVKFTLQQSFDRRARFSELTGIKKGALHRYDNLVFLQYTDEWIFLRFMQRIPEYRFQYRYANRDVHDEPRLPRNCSDCELGQKILDWIITLPVSQKGRLYI